MRFGLIWCVIASLFLCSCAGNGAPVVSTGDRYSVNVSSAAAYQLGTGDKLRMTVFREPTLSGEFAVSSAGTLSLPLIGDINAAGKTADQVAALVQAKLAEGYLRNPRVSMEVISYRPFFILGEVKNPGQYPYANGLTALNAIATAQGFTPRANRTVAYIRREGSTDEQPFKITPDLQIYPGDTVRIGERYF